MKGRLAILVVISVMLSPPLVEGQIIQPIPPPGWFNVGKVIWGTGSTESYASPGDRYIPLEVTLQNIGNNSVTGLNVKLRLAFPFSNITGGEIASAYYGSDIQPGQSAAIKFTLNISPRASRGEYKLFMDINYLQSYAGVGKTIYMQRSTSVEVPVQITGQQYMTVFDVNIAPPEASAGGNITISGNIVYTLYGQTASNTSISLRSPVVFSGRNPYTFIGQVDPNVPRPFSVLFRIDPATKPGAYPIEITVNYLDTLLISHTVVRTEQVRVTPFEPGPRTLPRRELSPWDVLWRMVRSVIDAFFGSTSPFISLNSIYLT